MANATKKFRSVFDRAELQQIGVVLSFYNTKFFEEDYVAYELNDINSKLEALKVSPENASEAETISTEQLETMLQARLILLEGTN
jgi:hypothetical protein